MLVLLSGVTIIKMIGGERAIRDALSESLDTSIISFLRLKVCDFIYDSFDYSEERLIIHVRADLYNLELSVLSEISTREKPFNIERKACVSASMVLINYSCRLDEICNYTDCIVENIALMIIEAISNDYQERN